MSDLIFAENRKSSVISGTWKVLVVDDDPGIHAITRTVLRDMVYENRSLEFISAYSKTEAIELYSSIEGISLVLLDVVMEEDDSGLQFVKYIREDQKNRQIRIILRTGQPGKAPSQKVIIDYDINDYEEKTDLTAQKLYTSVIASLRNYSDLESLETNRAHLFRHRAGLARISECAGLLIADREPDGFARRAYDELLTLLSADGDSHTYASFVALQDGDGFRIIASGGGISGSEGKEPREIVGDRTMESLRALKRDGRNLSIRDGVIQLYEDARQFRLLLHVSGVKRLEVQDHQILDIFSSNVGVAFENIRLNREIAGTQEDLLIKLGQVVETRAHDTAQHVKRVGALCEMLAAYYGMDEGDVHALKMASALHDIGKIGIPDEILLKPDVLTEEEFDVVRKHPNIGWDLLKDSSRPLLKIASHICLEHHERVDGKGYPMGLKDDEIHLNARIVAICDVFDSLTHGRLDREPWSVERAAAYLREERGRAFDADITDLLLQHLDEAVAFDEAFPN